jgi:cytoskeletal protein RodZ
MSELGQHLVEARTAKELSLADVEKATRIRQKYLEGFEQGDYASLPRGAVARGFLRTYATYLGLDADDALRRYSQESGDTDEQTPIAEVGKPRLVDYRPVEVELLDTRPNLEWVRWVVALVIVAALAAAAWWFLGRDGGTSVLATVMSALGPAPTSTNTASATPTRWIITATPTSPSSPGAVTVMPTSDLLPLPTPTVPPTITPTPRPTATPEVVARIALTARVGQRAWVRVTADGLVALETTLEPGQTQSWDANNSLKVLTGNAGGIELILNGAEMGKMGNVGQVIERSWVVEQGQVNEQAPTTGTGTPAPARTPTQTPTRTPTPAG